MARCGWSLLVAGCAGCGDVPVLEPAAGEARVIEELWWLLLLATGVPALLVIGVFVLGLSWRPPVSRGRGSPDPGRQRLVILAGGAVLTPLIIGGLLIASVVMGSRARPSGGEGAVLVDVVGRQYWWEVRYPEEDIVTANEIHVPVGRPVRLRLASGDVIHSFWVPRLAGKLDMVPGQVNELRLQVDEPGVYRGQCAEFCGVQHALMLLDVVAEPPEVFARWVAANHASAAAPGDSLARRGLRAFRAAECGHCHTVKGITRERAMGAVGPDLTHFAGRRRLGAGVRDNNRGNLAGWILNPQDLKPGNHMPPSELTSEELHALLHFLETLR